MTNKHSDGVHSLVEYENMSDSAKKLRDFYSQKSNAPIVQEEFGYYCLDRWKSEGHIDDNSNFKELFGFDDNAKTSLGQLGWCEAAFEPCFKPDIIEDRGKYEVVQDEAGRHVLCFKNRRSGFMPEYLDHPVKDMKSWEEKCKWRLDPTTSTRYDDLEDRMNKTKELASQGNIICQNLVGGYMYLRSLIGPEELLYMFYDKPELIHECMQTWLEVSDFVIAKHQEYVTLDEFYLAEDICFNKGSLISPDMIREFLFPYYQQLISNTKARQIDKNRHMFFQVDTDGYSNKVIPVYQELGLDYMSPFEVASGSDVVAIGEEFPNLLMRGGIDKRILATTTEAIDREINRIMPTMIKRGGYIPVCDHGVPEEVSFENYMHYRKRMQEF